MRPGSAVPRRSPYRRRFDLAGFRERFQKRLTSRFGMRLHMSLLVAFVFAAAFLASRLLLAAGVRSMGLRYLVASLVGYVAFFGLVRAWLWYVMSEVDPQLHPDAAPDSVARAADQSAPAGSYEAQHPGSYDIDIGPDLPSFGGSSGNRVTSGGVSSGGGTGWLRIDGDGCVAVLIIAVVAVVAAVLFGAAGFIVYQAPSLLGEAAFEVVIASVLAGSSRQVTRAGWTGSVLQASWKPALLMTLVVTLGGFIAQGLCPGQITLRGVIRQCVLDKT